MTSNLDFADFTNVTTRQMLQETNSPIVSVTSGWNSVTLTLYGWERSLNLLVQNADNVISLNVVGVTSGFTYLAAAPAYDSGFYYVPAMPVVDTQVTLTWYQVNATSVTIYAIGSDEPIAQAIVNPITPTQSLNERLLNGFPVICPSNATTTFTVSLDSTTQAVRCTIELGETITWGKVVGGNSGTVYYDGSATNVSFPTTPIPVNINQDVFVDIIVKTTALAPPLLYVALVNSADFSGNIPLVQGMSSNELAPNQSLIDTPNQLPVTFDGTVPLSGTVSLLPSSAGIQYRLHQILITLSSAVATDIDLEDTSANIYCHIHFGTTLQTIVVPLFGMVAPVANGLQLKNRLAAVTGNIGLTLWYSVL